MNFDHRNKNLHGTRQIHLYYIYIYIYIYIPYGKFGSVTSPMDLLLDGYPAVNTSELFHQIVQTGWLRYMLRCSVRRVTIVFC